jgi:luciferase family oxidoreductase group 1
MSKLKLSVVDQSPVHQPLDGNYELTAPELTVELARACDRLGYHRYWLAEHHNSIHFAGPCPEILITRIASVTQHMRIGSGGVMLTHYSAFKVAEVFRMLATLFPGRIDLGIGRAPGSDRLAMQALAAPHVPDSGEFYARKAADLHAYLSGQLPAEHPYARLQLTPATTHNPELWMLGSGGGSATLAGQLGMGLALARFIAPDACSPEIFAAHQQAFEAANHPGLPPRMLAIAAICAETREEAELIAGPAVYRKLMVSLHGRMIPLLTPAQVQDKRRAFSPSDTAAYEHILRSYTCGTPQQCHDDMQQLAEMFGVNEIGIVTVTYDFESRLRSYQLLATPV